MTTTNTSTEPEAVQTSEMAQNESVNDQQTLNKIPSITSPGVMLRTAREKKKLTIEEVAKELKLSKQYIIEIENDTYKSITSAIYARGYLQAYGRLMGIDCNTLISAFNALSSINISSRPRVRDPFELYTKHPSNTEQYWQWMVYGVLGFVSIVCVFGIVHIYKTLTQPSQIPFAPPLVRPLAATTALPTPVAVAPVHQTHSAKHVRRDNQEEFSDYDY